MTTLEIDGIELEVTVTDFDCFPKDIEEAEVIRSKETNSSFINKKFFGAWVSKYLKEIPLDTLSVLFTKYKDQAGLRRICLWFLGEEFFHFEEVLKKSKDENINLIEKMYHQNIVNIVKDLSQIK